MSKKVELYQSKLIDLDQSKWKEFIIKNSNLPGPRGNLELVFAVAELGDESLFRKLLSFDSQKAPVNTPYELLPVCGVVGLGRILAKGRTDLLSEIKRHASDPRWRMREGVVMSLYKLGIKNFDTLFKEMNKWAHGNMYEKRAAAAALCDPKILDTKVKADKTLKLLEKITDSLKDVKDTKSEDFQALKKGLSYCWSVAVAQGPEQGKKLMEKFMTSKDKNIISIMKKNLTKNRLKKVDPKWVEKWTKKLR
jgi:hypothetical protein